MTLAQRHARRVVAATCLLACSSVPAREPLPLDQVLEPVRARHDVPALAGAVLEHGVLTWIGAVGVRRVGGTDPVTTADHWHLGSCGKAMTATVLARLVERGAVRWDSTLAGVFPERAAAMAPGFRVATVRQLLDHRAGLPANTAAQSPFTREVDPGQPPTAQRLAILDQALSAPPVSPPGQGHRYANTGYLIAGAVIERITGEPWSRAMQELLFAPLGMESAGTGPPGRGAPGSQPCGHARVFGRVAAIDPEHPLAAHPAFYGPAGDVHASLTDWARFLAVHFAGAPGQDALLTAATLSAMHTPVAGADSACGFVVTSAPGATGPVLAHHGASPWWHTLVQGSVADQLVVLVACNHGGDAGAAACHDAAAALVARCRGTAAQHK